MKAKKYTVAIFGGGVQGLLLALRLTDIGIKCIILEQNPMLAKGPSTKCEGILHTGIYHAASIDDLEEALNVAKKCRYGYDFFSNMYRQTVEEYDLETIAVIKNSEFCKRATDRWEKAGVHGVQHSVIDHSRVAKIIPEANLSPDWHYFKIQEKSINTRLLLHTIQKQIERSGCGVILNNVVDIRFLRDQNSFVAVRKNEDIETINADFIIYAAGLGTKVIFKKEFNMELPINIFKAHLLNTKRLAKNNLYFIEPNEITIFHHRQYSIIGATRYNTRATDEDLAELKNDPDAVELLESKTEELFNNGRQSILSAHPCLKVDYGSKELYQSLDSKLIEPISNHFILMPGKLTESPWLSDETLKVIFARMDSSDIARRPCDDLTNQLKPVHYDQN